MKVNLQEHKYLTVIVIAAFVFYLFFVHNRLYGEINGSFISYGFVWKESFIPFWSTQLSGGHPLYAQPEIPLFGILNLTMLIIPGVILAFSFSVLIHLIIAGLGASLLTYELVKSKHAAIVSGISYMFIGSFAYAVFTGILPHLYPLAFFPLILLFAYKAIHKNTLRNSLIAAFFLAYQLISGGTIYFLWSLLGVGVFLGTYFLFSLLRFKKRELVRIAVIGAILLVFTLGFAAVKLLPALDFNKLSNRADTVGYEDFIWRHTQITTSQVIPQMFGTAFSPIRNGVIIFILAAASLLTWRRKYVLALALAGFVALLIEIETPLTKLIFQLPGYDKTRQIYHVLAPFSLAVAVLAGIGWSNILKRIKVKQNLATTVIVLLIVSELFILGYHVQKQPFETNFQQQLEDNKLLQNISVDDDYYRLHLYGEDFVGLSMAKYAVPYGIRLLDWTTSNIWFNDYIQFTIIAGQQNSAKLWGMANVKYIVSRDEVNLPELEFINKFEECEVCDLKGSYLYRNTLFLPEAYIAKNRVLIIGDEAGNFGNSYALILDATFNASRTAIVNMPNLPADFEDYGLLLFASGSISQGEVQALNNYVSDGGIVEPRIHEGINQVNYESIRSFLAESTPITEAKVLTFQPTKVEIRATDSGLLVISEKFYKFNEWKASINGKGVEKLTTNMISTGVFVNKGDVITFEYVPKTFYYGLAITIITIIAAFSLIVFERKLKHKTHQNL